jgi:hypothetical protein
MSRIRNELKGMPAEGTVVERVGRRNCSRKSEQKILEVVWAFKAKSKEFVDKKDIKMDPSRKSQELTTKQRVE